MKKILSMLLVLAVLFSCITSAFVTGVAAATEDKSSDSDLIVADWLFNETIYYRGADEVISEYADLGVTDVFFLVKGTAGRLAWASEVSGTVQSYSGRDLLAEVCEAANEYGVRVHCWMAVGQDETYRAANPSSAAYHFRIGTSYDSYDLTAFMDLRDSSYRAYMRALIKELNTYDIAGIHFDYIRYGTLFYDWGASARNSLINDYGITTAEYNAAVKAMCVTANEDYSGNYCYTTNSDGYYIYSSSGTYASGVNFAEALAGQGSTDALNGTSKVAQMRKDLVKNFIAEATADLDSDKQISCAIMPESVDDYAAQAYYCQDPAVLKDVVDFVSIMSYASQYGSASTWPATLAKTCALDGCNAVAAVQTFDCENSNSDPTCTDIYNEFYNVVSAKEEIADDSSYTGKILGCAFFRAAKMTLASAYVKDSSTLNFTVHQQDELETGITKLVFTMKNGVTISSISNKSGWGSSTFTISSDKSTLTITSSSEILTNYGSATFDMTYSGTISETTGACFMQSYNSSGEDYGFCNTVFQRHTHSYTSEVTSESTCTVAGVMTYTCSCGDSYTESLPLIAHSYSSVVTTDPSCSQTGIRLYSCSMCSSAYTEEIAKTAHSYTGTYNEETGMTTYTCVSCGTTFESNCGLTHERIETWSSSDSTHSSFCYNCNVYATNSCYFVEGSRIPAMCTTDGSITYICGGHYDELTGQIVYDAFSGSGCTNTYTETIPAACSFTYASNLDGTHHRVCVSCGAEEDSTACTFTNGTCTLCGYSDAEYTLLHFKNGSSETSWNWEFANGNGTLSFDSTSYGAMVGTSTVSSGNPYFLVWPQDTCGINHTVVDGDVVEVRLRLNVTDNPDSKTTCIPDVRLQNGSSAYASLSGNATQTLSLETTDWQTIQIPIIGKVYSEGFVINRILFDPWNALMYLGAQIEVDYIYIGQPDTAPSASASCLFFDFTNTELSSARYNGNQYEGYNFDIVSWSYDASASSRPTFSYDAEGTLTVGGITGSTAYAQTAPSSSALPATPLEYTTASGDIVEMRFKTANLTAADGETPAVSLYYDTDNAATVSRVFTFATSDILSGEYVTVRTAATAGQLISALRPTISGVAGNGAGQFIIDYIYIGSADNSPSTNADMLYFDFTATDSDAARYDSYPYGYYNYDLSGWGTNTAKNEAPTYDAANGYMTTLVVGESPYVQINAGASDLSTRPLNFDPTNTKMVQVRLKLSNLEKSSDISVPAFVFKFITDDATQATTNSYLTYKLTDAQLSSDDFITITLPVGDYFEDVTKVTSIQLCVANVQPISGQTASITFDSIYVGPQKDNVNFLYFYNASGTYCLDVAASVDGSAVSYRGEVPYMEPTSQCHYDFEGWVDASGNTVNLSTLSLTQDMTVYVFYSTIAHEFACVGSADGHNMQCTCGVQTALEEHDWDSGVVTTVATCTTDGVTTYTCGTCGYTREETFSASGHTYTSVVTAPTCTAQGYTTYTCPCGESYVSDYVSAIGHNYSITVVEATCTQDGYTSYLCSNCGDSYTTDAVSAYGHSYSVVTTAATCTTDGQSVYTCANCADTYTVTIAALGHSAVYMAKTAATCTTDGYGAHYHCETCGKNYIDAGCVYAVPDSYLLIAATGHSVTYYADKAATCTEDGNYAHYKCDNCSACFVDADCVYALPAGYVTISATGHTVVTDAAVAATCSSTGLTEGSHCSVCGEVIVAQQTVATLSHSYTYTDNGDTHTVGCENCSYSVTANHNYTDGVCTCGAKETTNTTVYNSNLTMSMNISIGAEMQVVYTILASKVSSYGSFYLEVVKAVADGESITTVYSLGNSNLDAITTSAGKVVGYSATYTGINAMEMGDEFTATLYAVASDGTVNYGTAVTGSIKDYLMSKLNDSTSSDALKTLAVDMLYYGAAAQRHFSYDTGNLVTADLTSEHKAYATSTSPGAVDSSSISGNGGSIVANVALQSKVMLYVTCSYVKSDDSNLEFVVKSSDGEVLERFAPSVTSAKIVQGIYSNVGAAQMRDVITIELYDNGELVSKTLTWSVESYVAQTRSDSSAALTLRYVVNAMLIYGDSAANYLASVS